ncbi:MAG: hypothetical protein RLZZ238_1133, partial [Planctomycetota bacterium]
MRPAGTLVRLQGFLDTAGASNRRLWSRAVFGGLAVRGGASPPRSHTVRRVSMDAIKTVKGWVRE